MMIKKIDKKFESITFLHLLIIILLWVSPFLFNWRLIILGIFLYYLQLMIFGNCILTKMEFKQKKREITMYSFVLEKLGFNVNRGKIVLLADYVFPWVILLISLVYQVVLNHGALIW